MNCKHPLSEWLFFNFSRRSRKIMFYLAVKSVICRLMSSLNTREIAPHTSSTTWEIFRYNYNLENYFYRFIPRKRSSNQCRHDVCGVIKMGRGKNQTGYGLKNKCSRRNNTVLIHFWKPKKVKGWMTFFLYKWTKQHSTRIANFL